MEHNTRHPRTANELPKRSIHPARVLTAGHQKRAAESTERWSVSIPSDRFETDANESGQRSIIIIGENDFFFSVTTLLSVEFWPIENNKIELLDISRVLYEIEIAIIQKK